MSGFSRIEDVLPCPVADEHEWSESLEGLSEQVCMHCNAVMFKRWWGFEFQTGTEQFSDHRYQPPQWWGGDEA